MVLATVGIGTTLYTVFKKESYQLWLPLGYFSLMELLQGFTYSVIDQCSLPPNQIATLLGYLHIAFQPFFINMISMYFIPEAVRKKIQGYVYGLCGISALIMLIQIYPFDWAGLCAIGRPLCSDQLCSVSGNWHIAWNVPMNGIGNSLYYNAVPVFWDGSPYMFVAFIVPFLYGSWRGTLYHYFTGPYLSWHLTDNVNEAPAIWCLMSIAILIIVVKTPIRRYLFVRKWLLWSKHLRAA